MCSVAQRQSRRHRGPPWLTPAHRTRMPAQQASDQGGGRGDGRTSTSTRFAHTHVWPAFRRPEATIALAAAATSASPNTMNGAFPPSSMLTRFTVSADCRSRSRPTRVDPVNVILRTTGLAVRVSPIAGAFPDTTLSTPAARRPTERSVGGLKQLANRRWRFFPQGKQIPKRTRGG